MTNERKVSLPEPPPGLTSGVLTEIWQNQKPMPRLRGLEVLGYYLQSGVQNLYALPGSSVITMVTMALSLFLLAGFILILQNVDTLLSEAGTTLSLTAYIKPQTDEASVKEFIRMVESNSRVRSVNFVSKQQALENFKKDLGSRSAFLDGLDLDNPLPSSVDILMRPDESNIGSLEKLVNQIKQHRVVDEVVYGSEWVERMHGIIRLFRAIGFVSLFFAMGIVVFLISNTIKLVIYSRRQEIAIMQLVGASLNFIRVPFLIGGVIQGFSGSLLALIMLKIGFALLNFEVRNSNVFGVALPKLQFLSLPAVVVIILVGLVVGALGSFFALGKFLNV